MDSLISIIVPVFNVEHYIEECLKSLINQTYAKIEIVVVDDGSTDSSPAICDKYSLEDSRVVVIHKKNSGLSSARNAGLDVCKGEYIGFVDSDDYVSEDYIQLLYKSCLEQKTDISICEFQYVIDDSIKTFKNYKYTECSYESYESIVLALKMKLRQTVWGKLYKKSVFDNIRFPEGKYFEDLAVFLTLY